MCECEMGVSVGFLHILCLGMRLYSDVSGRRSVTQGLECSETCNTVD